MLTVIIHRKNAQGFIDKYRSMFEPYIDQGKIAFCYWDDRDDKKNIETALTQLKDIVRGERRWRAVVALPLTDGSKEEREKYPARADNPFDFLENREMNPPVEESRIPLIRIAQMLGGVPPVLHHFEERIAKEKVLYSTEKPDAGEAPAAGDTAGAEGKAAGAAEGESEARADQTYRIRRSVRRMEDEESLERQQEIWEQLSEQYSFVCEKPSELLLFAARQVRPASRPRFTDEDMMNRHESDSSLFWQRNRYPARTRFLVQDCTGPGNARYREDLFKYWMTLLTLALNDFPPGTIEAYKLYRAQAIVSRDMYLKVLSAYYSRLANAKYAADQQIESLREGSLIDRERENPPDFSHEINVEFQARMDPREMLIEEDHVGLSGDCPDNEILWFNDRVSESRKNVRILLGSTRIELDRKSLEARYNTRMFDEQIRELDEYQYAEQEEKLQEIEERLLTFHSMDILPLKKYQKEFADRERDTRADMGQRMTKKRTILTGIVVLLVFLAGFIPDYYLMIRDRIPGWQAAVVTAGGIIILVSVMLVCLRRFRGRIDKDIKGYNAVIERIRENINAARRVYSHYLTDCCSYMRGRYMLNVLRDRTLISSSGIAVLTDHSYALEGQLHTINDWLKDLSIHKLEGTGASERTDFDFDIPPGRNREYYMQLEEADLTVPLTDGGTCMAPFPFVTGLEVVREAIFDDPTGPDDSGEEKRA